jgi:hypothetical protein
VAEHGLYGTARALGVSYGALKRQVHRHDEDRGAGARVRLVELPPAVVDRSVIELESAAGLTVRVRLNGVALSDVAAVARLIAGAAS